MYMGVYFTWAVMTVMSSRVYLNLVLLAHGGGTDGVTTGGLSSFHTGRANHPETEMEVEHSATFGAKRMRRHPPLTTFTMVSLCIFSSLYLLSSLTAANSPDGCQC
jgi:hypothetical protein